MIDVRPLGTLAAGLLLVGCAASNVKPQPTPQQPNAAIAVCDRDQNFEQ